MPITCVGTLSSFSQWLVAGDLGRHGNYVIEPAAMAILSVRGYVTTLSLGTAAGTAVAYPERLELVTFDRAQVCSTIL